MKFKNSFLKLILTIAFSIAVIVCAYFLLDDLLWIALKLIGLFLPFIVAYFVSVLVNPLVNKLERRLKIPRPLSTIIVILLTVGIIGGIVFAVCWKIVDEIQTLYSQFPQIVAGAKESWEGLSEKLSNINTALPESFQNVTAELGNNLAKAVSDFIKNSYTPVVSGIGNFAKALPRVFVWIIVFVLSLYFMIADSKTMRHFIGKCFSKRFLVHIRNVQREIKRYLGGYIKAQIIIMSIAAIILLIGLSLLDVEYALLIAIGIALLDALPFFGSGAVLWPWSVISFINGDLKRGIGMIVIYLAVIFMRQMIEPKIVSENIGIYPVFTLMSMYLGYKIFSIGGMILGPVVLILAVSFYKAGALDGILKFFKRFFGRIWSEIKDLYSYFK